MRLTRGACWPWLRLFGWGGEGNDGAFLHEGAAGVFAKNFAEGVVIGLHDIVKFERASFAEQFKAIPLPFALES